MGMLDILGGGGGLPDYKAYDTRSGLGSTVISGDEVTTKLAAPYQSLVEQLRGGLGGMTPEMSGAATGLGRQALGAGAGFLSQIQEFDPFAAAETQFGRLEEILQPGRERQAQEMEGRLLRQGRLGSTGGALSEQALSEAHEQSRRQNLYDAFAQAQQTQAQQVALGTQLGAFGLGAEETAWNRYLQGLQATMGLEQAPLAFAEHGTALAGQRSQHQQRQAALEAQRNKALMGAIGGIASGVMTGGLGPLLGAGLGGGGMSTGGGGGMFTGATAGFDPTSLLY